MAMLENTVNPMNLHTGDINIAYYDKMIKDILPIVL